MSYSTRIYRKRNVNLQNDIKVKSPAFFHSHETRVASKNSDTAFFQPKLSIGQPNDAYEKEADSVADKVVSNPTGNIPGVQQKEISSIQRVKGEMDDENISDRGNNVAGEEELQQKPDLQKKCDGCEKEEKEKSGVMQMKPEGGSIASPKISSKIKSSSGKGNTLPGRTLSEMNHSFGSDFSNVKIHTDSEAVQLNRELGAQAFTHGNDIYFNSSKFDPASSSGKHLLAHELTHVVQQNGRNNNFVQRSCSPAELVTLHTSMHGFCDLPRRCNMQTDTCPTAVAKIAAGNGCISLRTIIQHRCFSPGDPGYQTHMQQIAQGYAALRNCYVVERAKCNEREPNPTPSPVPAPSPSSSPQSTFEKIKEFARNVIEQGLDAEQAAEDFLRQNPGMALTIVALGVIGIIALLADDATIAGILDDVLIPVIATLVRVAWRFAF